MWESLDWSLMGSVIFPRENMWTCTGNTWKHIGKSGRKVGTYSSRRRSFRLLFERRHTLQVRWAAVEALVRVAPQDLRTTAALCVRLQDPARSARR